MQVLPKKDGFEALHIHSAINLLILGKSFVLIENLLPLSLGGRRQNTHHGSPINHRQTGTRQASDSPDNQNHDHTEANAS